MATKLSFKGLRKKPTYEEMIDYLQNDQEVIRYPNRYAKFLRDSPWLSQMDGQGMRDMEEQQVSEMREHRKEQAIREMAMNTGQNVNEIRAEMAHNSSFAQTEGGQDEMSDTAPQQPPPPPPPPSPPPTETSSRRMQGSGPLPQEDVMMHMSPHMPPPPPPDRPRVTISTSELGTQTQQSEGVDVGTQANDYKPEGGANNKIKRMIGKTKRGLKIIRIPTKPEEGQVDVPMGSGGYPPPPPPPGAATVYHTIGHDRSRDRAMAFQDADHEMAQVLAENTRNKRISMAGVVQNDLSTIERGRAGQPKKAASESHDAVADRMLDMAHQAAKTRAAERTQATRDIAAQRAQMNEQAANIRSQIEAGHSAATEHLQRQKQANDAEIEAKAAELRAKSAELRARETTVRQLRKRSPAAEQASSSNSRRPPPAPPPAQKVKAKAKAKAKEMVTAEEVQNTVPVKRAATNSKARNLSRTKDIGNADPRPPARSRSRARARSHIPMPFEGKGYKISETAAPKGKALKLA